MAEDQVEDKMMAVDPAIEIIAIAIIGTRPKSPTSPQGDRSIQ